jgi:release factor glutamine methyltransferase
LTRKQALARARGLLIASGVEDASIEAEVLLRHVLQIDRAQLYLDLDRGLSERQQRNFEQLIERRLEGEPSAYITGHREFYGLDFEVNPGVLIPRPETELLVERAVHLAEIKNISTIADIGTGCGAIATALALHLPETEIYATDISARALEVARINCRRHGVAYRIRLFQGDLLQPLPEPVDLIAANLPYVEEMELAKTGLADFEPSLALNGGRRGLTQVFRLCYQAAGKLRHGGSLLLEIGLGQANPVVDFLHTLFPSTLIEIARDPGGIERVLSLSLTHSGLDAKLTREFMPEKTGKR